MVPAGGPPLLAPALAPRSAVSNSGSFATMAMTESNTQCLDSWKELTNFTVLLQVKITFARKKSRLTYNVNISKLSALSMVHMRQAETEDIKILKQFGVDTCPNVYRAVLKGRPQVS